MRFLLFSFSEYLTCKMLPAERQKEEEEKAGRIENVHISLFFTSYMADVVASLA